MKTILIILLSLMSAAGVEGQVMSVKEAVARAVKDNPALRAVGSNVEARRQLKRTGFDLPKTDVVLMLGQYNGYPNDNNVTITQSIPFTTFGGQAAVNRENLAAAELRMVASENELVYRVKKSYYQLSYLKARHKLLLQQDSLFEGFYKSASLRFKTGETNLLEQTTAEGQRNESKNALFVAEADILVMREQLKALLNSNQLPDVVDEKFSAISFEVITDSLTSSPSLATAHQDVEVAKAERKLASARFAPDLLVGYFTQTLTGTMGSDLSTFASPTERFTGFQVGLSIPLWFVSHHARVRAAKYATAAAQSEYDDQRLQVNAAFRQARHEHEKNIRSLRYYENVGLPNAELIIKQSKTAFREGEADYAQYLLGVKSAIAIQENYLNTLNDFNQTIIYLEYLSGNK